MYIKVEDLDIPDRRKALVGDLQTDVRKAKKHFKNAFDRIIEDMDLAFNGAPKGWPKTAYRVNITQRFIRQKVASLYAKNPRATAKRKKQLSYKIWDGDSQTLMTAQMQI